MRLARFAALAVTALAIVATGARAQYGPTTTEVAPNNYPPPLPERQGPAPKLKFDLAGEIALTGPVGTTEAWADGSAIVVPLESGAVRVVPETGDRAPVAAGGSPAAEDAHHGWIVDTSGTKRYRATAEGIVEAERRRKPTSRWKRSWKIVAPNAIPAAPILLGPRLCYAGLDDRVTCVRASNGHRLWTTDLGDRLSRPIARWPAAAAVHVPERRLSDRALEGEILLAVPDNGASLIALDAYDGRRLAVYELPASSRLVSGPFVLAEDRVVAVREAFDKRDVAVLVLRLLPYNERPPAPTSPSGR